MYGNQYLLNRYRSIAEFARSIGWILFSRTDRDEVRDCAILMADIVTGSADPRPEMSMRTPLIGDTEDFAYLVGFFVIESLQHRTVGRLWMLHQFKQALGDRGLSGLEAATQAAQFQAFYWNRMESLTWGAARRLSRRKLQKLLPSVYRLRKMTGQPALFY